MQCVEFENRLNRLLDNRLDPGDDPQLAAHEQQCEECAGVLQAQQRLFAGLRVRTEPPADFSDRVLARRHWKVERRRKVWRTLGWRVLLASAASIGGIALLNLPRGDNQLAQPQPVDPAPAPVATKSGLAIAATGAKATRPTTPEEKQKIEAYGRYLEGLATRMQDRKQLAEVSESLSPSIEPIRSSFGLALDALRRTMPGGRDPQPKPAGGAHYSADLPVIG